LDELLVFAVSWSFVFLALAKLVFFTFRSATFFFQISWRLTWHGGYDKAFQIKNQRRNWQKKSKKCLFLTFGKINSEGGKFSEFGILEKKYVHFSAPFQKTKANKK
jgi:hypothetical protein